MTSFATGFDLTPGETMPIYYFFTKSYAKMV